MPTPTVQTAINRRHTGRSAPAHHTTSRSKLAHPPPSSAARIRGG